MGRAAEEAFTPRSGSRLGRFIRAGSNMIFLGWPLQMSWAMSATIAKGVGVWCLRAWQAMGERVVRAELPTVQLWLHMFQHNFVCHGGACDLKFRKSHCVQGVIWMPKLGTVVRTRVVFKSSFLMIDRHGRFRNPTSMFGRRLLEAAWRQFFRRS